MKLNLSKNANYLGGVIIILAFALLYFSYFFIYIPRQENRLQQRAFRILKEYGNNMFDKNSYYTNHFENYKLYYSIRYYSKTNDIVPLNDTLVSDVSKSAEIKNVIENLYDYVECKSITAESNQDTSFIYSNRDNLLFLNYGAQINQSAEILEESIDEISEYYQLTNTVKTNVPVDSSQKYNDLFNKNRLQYLVPIGNLMEGLKFDRLFDNIILFDRSRVYYNSKLELVTDITRPAALCDSVESHQGGIWESINIRGKDKQVMVLPIDFLGKRFYVAGIISESEYHKKTRTIDNQFIIIIAVILLLVLISMPILKIIFIGKNERLKSTDASTSLISSIFGTGLLILMILGIIKHKVIDHPEIENRITQISNTLYQNVVSDIDTIKALYMAVSLKDTIGDSATNQQTNNYTGNNDLPCPYTFSEYAGNLPFYAWTQGLSNWTYHLKNQENRPLAQFTIRKFMESDRKFHMYNDSLLKNIFPINEIILIRNNGIIAKAVTSTPFSELVPVDLSQRNYFKNAKTPSTAWPTKINLDFYIESIKSYNTGDGETAISFHNANCDDTPVTAITSAIPSLYKQVLPKDVEFVIIDPQGQVYYHSIKSKNLHENFLNECDFDEQLQTAIDFRTESIFQIEYNERNWMLRIIPFEDTPLFHITLIDLEQNNNKNARIFLFTFYFLMITLVFIGLGMIILRMSTPKYSNAKNTWFLAWILYRPEKTVSYINLSLVLLVVIIVQYLGFSPENKPVAILLYNLIFIVYSLFVTLTFLTRKNFHFKHLIQKRLLPENIILLIILLLIVIFFAFFSTGAMSILSIGILVFVTFCLPYILRNTESGNIIFKITPKNKKRTYLIFLFLWLICLAFLPIIQSYESIKNQESEIEQQQQLFTIAKKNLELFNEFHTYESTPWFKRIQGNGIDQLKVEFIDDEQFKHHISPGSNQHEKHATRIYSLLPDPVTNNYEKTVYVNDSNFVNREWVKNDTLFFSKNGTNGMVKVFYDSVHKKQRHWNVLFILVIAVIIASLWAILKYTASVILNLQLENPTFPKSNWNTTIFENQSSSLILLQTYHPEYFLQKTIKSIQKNGDNYDVIDLPAGKLADSAYSIPLKYINEKSILWISGLDQMIYEIEKHDAFLTNLMDVCRLSSGKIIIEMPFHIDFVDVVYKEAMLQNEKNIENPIPFDTLKNKWILAFRNFIEFNGYYQFYEDADTNKEMYKDIDNTELQFDFIWNNLTDYEKIVLFDLADDGLVNTKNNQTIKRLVRKNIITVAPSPAIISNDFRKYILNHLSSSSVKELERKLGLKRKWKNTRYLILIILIPMAAFVMISQGLSVEKIFGIFAGVLTVITGVTRLFDSQFFKQSAT